MPADHLLANNTVTSVDPQSNYQPYPTLNNDTCYYDKNHDSADLCAQWRAAIAAEKAASRTLWGNWISLGGALLSFVSVVLVVIALRQTRNSNRIAARDYAKGRVEARAAAAESARALTDAKLSEERQTRAYVFVDSISITIASSGINKGRTGAITTLKNTGRTPAFDVRHLSEIHLLEADQEGLLKLPETLERRSETDIASGGSISAARLIQTPISRADAAAIRRGDKVIFVHGITTYRDAFGRDRKTCYRTFYNGSWPPNGVVNPTFCDDGNEAE